MLDRDAVAHLARLARLSLSAEELEALTPQLDAVVEYESRLSELDLTGVEPLAHALDAENHLRDDLPHPTLPPEEATANAPQRREGAFVVPAALE
jgi:aspartyl-tRNA(Asn)/glutamyl-tRNA(Gln) amidotransferase subunit C